MGTTSPTPTRSMPEVHSSVDTASPSIWKRMFAFAGPAYLVSVGYMDPGNWATDLEGGARFGYDLLWVLVMSNAMAILLQTLSARLGIVTGRDLAQACRETYPKAVSWVLWILCEIAIAACDLAEVLGAAIGLNLLFGIPLLAGVLLTTADTLLVLWFTRFGIRVMESMILAFISIIGACFMLELFLAKPVASAVVQGLIPRLTDQSLYVAIGILGATVMPHNLYLHSSLVQTRNIASGEHAKRSACRFNLVDSFVALNGAMFVNAAILVLAGTVFFRQGIAVTEIQQAHHLLTPLLGTTMASMVFAIALLCAGQSSTISGTMAGQIVMEGFLNIRMRPWLRRLVTRAVAVTPAALAIMWAGDKATYKLLIFSQVVLSLQLPFAVVPLIQFTSDRKRMGAFANRWWVRILAWTSAAVILGLNMRLAYTTFGGWVASTGTWLLVIVVPLSIALLGLLGYIAFHRPAREEHEATMPPAPSTGEAPLYRRILVTLDHTGLDAVALRHATALARLHQARLFLLHVEEGVASQIYGPMALTAEVEEGRRYFEAILEGLREQHVEAELRVVHSKDPKSEIVRFVAEVGPDLVVMGAHGHKGLKDVIFGATINEVRHEIATPVLIVRADKPL
jgi:manganese transport protein